MAFRWMPPKKIKKKKSGNAQKVLDKLKEYLESSKATGEPIQILCRFWEDQQTVITYQELRQAVMDGAISKETIRLWQQDYSILVANQLSQMWTNAFKAGAAKQSLLEGLDFKFDMQTPGITKWINERGAEFVTVSTQEQKNAIAALLTKKMRDNHSVDELARMIRPCIGLTEGQAKANVRYYDSIVANLKKEHPRMKPESMRKKARDAAAKYAERQHRQRAMMIAQTESAFAYNRGADEGIRQAQSQNLLGIVKKRWSTSGDDAVCQTCSSLEGVEIDMDADFDLKGKVLFPGHHMLPPAHPRCACAIEYIEVEPPVIITTNQEYSSDNDKYLIRDNTPEQDTTSERNAVNEAISEVPKKVQEALANGTVIDVGKNGASQYDYEHDILYVAKGARKSTVIHEIGHMVENKMMTSEQVADIRRKVVGNVSVFDFTKEIYEDASKNEVEVTLLINDKFISEYQGRIYVEDVFESLNEDGTFKDDLLWEFISEAFREYIENPNRLKRKNKELYNFIKEAVE